MVTQSEIFKALDQYRKREKVSVKTLAKEAGLSRQQYYRMLKGERRIYIEAIEDMANHLGLRLTLSIY